MKKLLLATVAFVCLVAYLAVPPGTLKTKAAEPTANISAAWDAIASGTPKVWMKMSYKILMDYCSVVFTESPATPNHRARVEWALRFWPHGANPITTIPTTIYGIMPKLIANGDVAYVISLHAEGDDSLFNPIYSVITTSCPAAQ